DGFKVREVLAFVVAGASGEKRGALDAWFERWCFPEIERFGRLDVVMPVDHEMRLFAALSARSFGHDDRVTGGRVNSRVQPDVFAMRHQPFGATHHVGAMLRLGGNARKANVIAKLANEAFVIVL